LVHCPYRFLYLPNILLQTFDTTATLLIFTLYVMKPLATGNRHTNILFKYLKEIDQKEAMLFKIILRVENIISKSEGKYLPSLRPVYRSEIKLGNRIQMRD
jgi:hypothetical protein